MNSTRMFIITLAIFVLLTGGIISCQGESYTGDSHTTSGKGSIPSPEVGMGTAKLTVNSPSFKNGKKIPKKFTVEGADISPALKWSGAPGSTESFVVICDDPDAPNKVWDHWIIFNIPKNRTSLPEGVPARETLPDGASHGANSWKKSRYNGPSPPPGKPHRYFFKVYALDKKLELAPGVDKKTVEEAMKGHIIAEGQLMGTYKR